MYDTALAPSPAASRLALPRWFDARMVVGILLVLASVVVGAKVFSSADSTTSVWAAARDLPAGARLQSADLKAVKVRLGDGSRYVAAAGAGPAGYVLTRPVGAGELLPSKAFVDPAKANDPALARREVTVPVRQDHWPADLRSAELVDVYATRQDRRCHARTHPGGCHGRFGAQQEPRRVRRFGTVGRLGHPAGSRRRGGRPGRCGRGIQRRPRTGADGPHGCPDGRGHASSGEHAVRLPVITAVVDARWEAGLVAAFEQAEHNITVVRRCVDLADLLATAATGTARAALLSADLRRLDRDALMRLAAAHIAVVGLVPPGDENADRRLRQLGVRFVLPADAAATVISAAVAEAVASLDDGIEPVALADPMSMLPLVPRPPAAPPAEMVPGTGRVDRGLGPDRSSRPYDDCAHPGQRVRRQPATRRC